MIILSAKDLTKEYGTDIILKDISFHVNEGDRVGIVGANGAGKTTLLRILSGEDSASDGDFFVSNDVTVGYLKQKDSLDSSGTVIEEVEKIFDYLNKMEKELLELSQAAALATGEKSKELISRYDQMHEEFTRLNGYGYKSEIKGILTSMAFPENMYSKPISTLSGGERTRLSLACLLLKKPKLLFLDEPTNHLDIGTLKWLEQYLKNYKGTILLVSHDRYFLNQTVNRIFEVENNKLHKYEGNYEAYAEQKKLRREEELKQYRNQQKEIGKQEELIRRFKGHGTEKLAKRAASREKKLGKMERLEKPEGQLGKMKIHFKENYKSGKDVVFAEDLAKGFGYGTNRKELFKHVNLDIKRGNRICIVGPNGIGKTTLMRMLMDELKPDNGYIKIGHNVEFGYYDQGQRLLNDENTVIEELKESYRLYSDTEMRSILGRFLFQNDSVFLPVSALSGGEKARLSLVKLMLSGANLLLMDEPTNHLDIDSKEVFEDALLEFPGTVIVVSHDRYFLNKIPTKIVELGHEGLTEYLGQYDYYMEKKQEIESGNRYLNEMGGSNNKPKKETVSAAEERKLKKEIEAKARREAREQVELEDKIEKTEGEMAKIEAEMCKEEVMKDFVKLDKLNEKLRGLKEELTFYYQKWLQ